MSKQNYSFSHKVNRRHQILAIIANIYALISLTAVRLFSGAGAINTNICMCVCVCRWAGTRVHRRAAFMKLSYI